ncbi:MAG: hypothetical protein Q4G22_00825 [Paracoccus sp. (in: a-proteobacteria)]|uniref:hypothetical protein n=1 Tax=Paracoccus sp. TaxID=267 RepID=UPI0026E0D3B8|nr:hypothetical protein [Paracoccus sp. (in: a-proteobacteria)]MDO5630360.1 hypothetical protein [Paracoccus sp. (in: a-proteobacteria)]
MAAAVNPAFDRRFLLLLFGTALDSALLTSGALLLFLLDTLVRPVDVTFARGALAVLGAVGKFLIFASVLALTALPFAAVIWAGVWAFGTRAGLSEKTRLVAGSILTVLSIAPGLWWIGNNLATGEMRAGLLLVALYGTPAALSIAPLLAMRLYRKGEP